MVDKREVQAGDDAVGADDPVNGNEGGGPDTMGLSPEEFAQFQEMERSSPRGEVVAEGDPDDAQAAADAAAAAQAQNEGGAADGDQGAADGQDGAAGDAGKQQAADDDVEEDPTEGGKFPQRVSYHKYKRTQDRLKAAEVEKQQLNEKLARTDERIKMIMEAAGITAAGQPKQPEQPKQQELGPPPDPEQDIFAYAKWQAQYNEQLRQQIEALQQGVVGTAEQQNDQLIERRYLADIQQLSASEAPDFKDAYNYLMATRVVELALTHFGVDLTQEGAQLPEEQYRQIVQAVEGEEKWLAKDALSKNRSPARQVYTMAKARGYRPAAAPAANGNGAAKPANGNGAAAPAAPAAPKSPVAAAVAAAKRGVATNQTLSSGGGAPDATLTSAQVFAMSDDDFQRWFNTSTQAEKEAVLGR